ncbi:hypothetical protein [Desulfonema ishimotonii]|uniref:hypothetical protein n=1 Tax=Desulfonema ishimotonii TaxID=45657 RepID=UPI000F55A7F6|nr:hypothetical protein [Desulfonema ishimotonii]
MQPERAVYVPGALFPDVSEDFLGDRTAPCLFWNGEFGIPVPVAVWNRICLCKSGGSVASDVKNKARKVLIKTNGIFIKIFLAFLFPAG